MNTTNKNEEETIKKRYVVYLDGSFQKGKEYSRLGCGIYIIDEAFNDIKIAIGKRVKKKRESIDSEIETLKEFIKFANSNFDLDNSEFIVYADCEVVVHILNKYKKEKSGGFSWNVEGLDDLNVVSAYWTKSHKQELGNLLVDMLAYNAQRNVENQEKFLLIEKNANLIDIFERLHRFPQLLHDNAEDNTKLNELCFNRCLDIENNFVSKRQARWKSESVLLEDKGDHYACVISGEEKSLTINNSPLFNAAINEVFKKIFYDICLLKEVDLFKKVEITIENRKVKEDLDKRRKHARKLIGRRSDKTLDKNLVKNETIYFMKDQLNKYAFIIENTKMINIIDEEVPVLTKKKATSLKIG